MKTIYLNSYGDCKWLKETHLKGFERPDFRSFCLVGNEDCPSEILLYAQKWSKVTDLPIAVFKREQNGLDLIKTK